MHKEFQVYLERLRAASSDVRDFSGIPRWLEVHTKDPLHNDRSWSFREHEYQMQILSDTTPEISMQKCSQVGASEIWVRMLLAMMAISKKITIIYILPSSAMSKRFSQGRIRPVIADSETLRGLLDRDLDNTEQKQIGRSMLYISGTFGQSSAISVPAQALFRDEVDFCNQRVLTTYDSRLGHSKEGEAIIRSFSTPTVFKYGINALFEAGSQARYLVRCPCCRKWVALDYLRDVVIPGFEGTLLEFEKESLLTNSKIDLDAAFFLCPECRTVIPEEALSNPAERKWVHAYPDRNRHHSYQVLPCDVPTINPLRRTLRQIEKYDSKKDWMNFKVGLPYEDAQSSFLESEMKANAQPIYVPRPDLDDKSQISSGHYMGIDVGNVCWITITKPNDQGGEDIVYQERIKQDGNNVAGLRAVQLFHYLGCAFGVIDAGPDITLAKFMVEALRGRFMACRYDTRNNVKTLDVLVNIDEVEGIVTVNRTGLFDALAALINKGRTRLTSKSSEYELAVAHLKSLKRVELRDEESGEVHTQWIRTGDDHYGHSLGYANVARRIKALPPKIEVVPYVPSVGSVRFKEAENPLEALRRRARFFGG